MLLVETTEAPKGAVMYQAAHERFATDSQRAAEI